MTLGPAHGGVCAPGSDLVPLRQVCTLRIRNQTLVVLRELSSGIEGFWALGPRPMNLWLAKQYSFRARASSMRYARALCACTRSTARIRTRAPECPPPPEIGPRSLWI